MRSDAHWNRGKSFIRHSGPRTVTDKLDELTRQVHSLTVENARLRGLLSREERKGERRLTRREKIEQERVACTTRTDE